MLIYVQLSRATAISRALIYAGVINFFGDIYQHALIVWGPWMLVHKEIETKNLAQNVWWSRTSGQWGTHYFAQTWNMYSSTFNINFFRFVHISFHFSTLLITITELFGIFTAQYTKFKYTDIITKNNANLSGLSWYTNNWLTSSGI